ncbi:uncharacterized protein [Littorina saxatilis]|uniref:uncharacterized protein n=1 Tax=Littorina saxatilis TaxID=31220 RepID=UPI0038B5CA9D
MPLSSALFLPLVLFVSVVTFEFSLADEKACSIRRHGTLTMFNGETTDVELPCKYRLADFTCVDYRVKVTPGSAVDQEDSHRFSPNTVWVKVVNANTSEFVKIRTSVRRLDKFGKNRTTNPWQVKEGSECVVDFADYDQSRAAAVLRKDGVFSVEFSSAKRSVVVTCSDREFVSEGLPVSLCGDETTTDAMNNAMTTLFPGQENMTDDALVSYIVLNHDNVVQSATCKDLASKFTSCQDKEQAAMECVAIFADPSQAECLATSDTSLAGYYYDCLTSVCDGDTSAVDPMNNYISDNCGPWLETSCDSDGDCPDGINATCFEGKCLCTPGYYYSNGQAVCVDSCPVADRQGEFLHYPNSIIQEYSILVQTADTVEECLAACAADSNCPTVEFEISKNRCYSNSITPLQDPDAFVSAISPGNYDLYQKRCA